LELSAGVFCVLSDGLGVVPDGFGVIFDVFVVSCLFFEAFELKSLSGESKSGGGSRSSNPSDG
jgi:hypothetical protein